MDPEQQRPGWSEISEGPIFDRRSEPKYTSKNGRWVTTVWFGAKFLGLLVTKRQQVSAQLCARACIFEYVCVRVCVFWGVILRTRKTLFGLWS